MRSRPERKWWIIQILVLIAGCYLFGLIFALLMGIYKYYWLRRQMGLRRNVFVILLASIITIAFLVVELTGPEASPFMTRTFFSSNCLVIKNSAGYERFFSADEKGAIEYAVKNIDHTKGATWPLVGYSSDDLMVGPVADEIDRRYGTAIYTRIMLKSLLVCSPELMHKAIRQIRYYYNADNSERIPGTMAMNTRDRLESGLGFLGRLSQYSQVSYLNRYREDVRAYLAATPQPQPEASWCRSRAHALEMWLSIVLAAFALIYSIVLCYQWRTDALVILFAAHTLVLLTIVVIHTLDMSRYSHSLFPLLAIVDLLALDRIMTGLWGMIRKTPIDK